MTETQLKKKKEKEIINPIEEVEKALLIVQAVALITQEVQKAQVVHIQAQEEDIIDRDQGHKNSFIFNN